MTDGILLAETQGDRLLEHYDTLIIDEAHERVLNIDFLLGYLKQLLPQRPDLKVIITSATIDPARFSRHFGDAQIVESSGRTYPVETRIGRSSAEEEDEEDPNLLQAIVEAVDELAALEARRCSDLLERRARNQRDGRSTSRSITCRGRRFCPCSPTVERGAEPDFPAARRRRIVLATNVAETSLTVPGIKYVVDPGFRADQPVRRRGPSAASADRADFTGVGGSAEGAVRTYERRRMHPAVFAGGFREPRQLYMEPEILRTNLASVILQMKALRLGKIEDFPFIDPPDGADDPRRLPNVAGTRGSR